MRVTGAGLIVAAALMGGAAACNSGAVPARGAPDAASAAAVDTLSGTVAVVGAAPLTRVVLRPAGGGGDIELLGAQRDALARLAGAEVRVSGRPTQGTASAPALEVASFAVTAVDGQPAVDGRLERADGELVLVTSDGRRIRLVQPPAALQDWVGARVWIAGPLDREPQAFGLIEPGV
ncbi:MAG: hypothetical protein DIU52_006005 [bacterium]|jgi:hypothetical protein|nr:MAG: hypothetical protein DIU52_04250 [bacterium]